jgi:hypothetical protein
MRPLKETLIINSEGELSEIIQRSGKQIGWIVVSVNTNEIEFHHSTMMTKMITLVSWTEAGNINISTSHKQKSVKVDIGGLRKGQNNKFILAVQREMAQPQKAVVTEIERGSAHKKKGLEQGNLYTPSPDDFSKQIALEDKKKKSLVMWIVIGVALVGVVSVLVSLSAPSEIIGKYYNEDGGGYIELKKNGEFIWADGNDIMVSGSYYSKSKRQESWGTVYHLATTPKEGRLKSQWYATVNLTKYTNHDTPKYRNKWMLRQRIAGAPGPFLFLRDINN